MPDVTIVATIPSHFPFGRHRIAGGAAYKVFMIGLHSAQTRLNQGG
jgi:hypothetical protein